MMDAWLPSGVAFKKDREHRRKSRFGEGNNSFMSVKLCWGVGGTFPEKETKARGVVLGSISRGVRVTTQYRVRRPVAAK